MKKIFLIGVLFFAVLISLGGVLIVKRNQVKTELKRSVVVPTHFFIVQREKLASLFVFGDYDSSNWHIILANKRISEAEELFKYRKAGESLRRAQESRNEIKKATAFFQNADRKGEDTNYLRQQIKVTLHRQQDFFKTLEQNSAQGDFGAVFAEIEREIKEVF